jgi:hypothetical protein
MVRYLEGKLTTSILAAVFLTLLLAPGAWADSYDSWDSSYFKDFNNNITQHYDNDMQQMDAVYFGGRHIIFFTLFSDFDEESYDPELYFYTPSYSYADKLKIGNSESIDLRFKLCVMNNVLYLFYTPSESGGNFATGTIYYRMVTIDYGSDHKGWKLNFSDEKALGTGLGSVTLRFAGVMNGSMYIVYTNKSSSGTNWYYFSSSDGLTFGQQTHFFTVTDQTLYGASGAVFQVPNTTKGSVEKFMLAYTAQNSSALSLKYFFFDGETSYGPYAIATPSLSPRSVRLIAGSAEGYSKDNYSIQVWVTSPDSNSESHAYLYHAEYVLDGLNGDKGSWSSAWNHLEKSDSDTVWCGNVFGGQETPDPCWTVIPDYSQEDNNTRMYLHLWYGRGTGNDGMGNDQVNFRCSSYQSDLLVHSSNSVISSGSQNLSTSTILGVIEGPPPFPTNNGSFNYNTSMVELNYTNNKETSTSVTVGTTVVATYGGTFLPEGVQTSLLQTSFTKTVGNQLSNYSASPPGVLGWLLLLQPEIKNDVYVLRSYANKPLAYGSDTSGNELAMSLLSYGSGTEVVLWPYDLRNPANSSAPIGTNNTSLDGMATRALSTEIETWQDIGNNYVANNNTSYTTVSILPQIEGTEGNNFSQSYEKNVTNVSTFSPSASFTASAKLLGFDVSDEINFSMDISATTSLQTTLGFNYYINYCDNDTDPCYSVLSVTPRIMAPTDAYNYSGYDAPWISKDIRNYQKPKPWCLSYIVTTPAAPNSSLSKLKLQNASGKMTFDRLRQNRDGLYADFTFKGIRPGFSLETEQLLHLGFGNYVINSDANPVYYRAFEEEALVVELREADHPNSRILVWVMHDRTQKTLRVILDAAHIDLARLSEYGFRDRNVPGIQKSTPFRFFIGSQYYVNSTVDWFYRAKKNKWGSAQIVWPHVTNQ